MATNETYQLAHALADVLPAQGTWTAADYCWLTERTNRLIELADGRLEVLPMPTEQHQRIVLALYRLLYAYILATHPHGILLVAPLRLRLSPHRYREPDLLYLHAPDDPRRTDTHWDGADLVLEVVSPSNAELDQVTKRREYAAHGIPEYWIVDPLAATLTVLVLPDQQHAYSEHGCFRPGMLATSPTFAGLQLDVQTVFGGA
ncbi:MAG: Uma2 family endonuclease [Chloroflexaceae bacterium]|nr:Uma2 family endonuclease [Chloroflexaceae bacterium]